MEICWLCAQAHLVQYWFMIFGRTSLGFARSSPATRTAFLARLGARALKLGRGHWCLLLMTARADVGVKLCEAERKITVLVDCIILWRRDLAEFQSMAHPVMVCAYSPRNQVECTSWLKTKILCIPFYFCWNAYFPSNA